MAGKSTSSVIDVDGDTSSAPASTSGSSTDPSSTALVVQQQEQQVPTDNTSTTAAKSSAPNQEVNMTPGISNFLRQQQIDKPQEKNESKQVIEDAGTKTDTTTATNDDPKDDKSDKPVAELMRNATAPPAAAAQSAIANLSLQVRESMPRAAQPESQQPSMPPNPQRLAATHQAASTANAQSSMAAIQNIAYGVKKTVIQQPLAKKIAGTAIAMADNETADGLVQSEVRRLQEQANRRRTMNAAISYRNNSGAPSAAAANPPKVMSTRNHHVWEQRGWDQRSAENAAMLQNHLLQSIQQQQGLQQQQQQQSIQQQKQQKGAAKSEAALVGAGWTAREAALIAESDPETLQRILSSQNGDETAAAATMMRRQQVEQQQAAAARSPSLGNSSSSSNNSGQQRRASNPVATTTAGNGTASTNNSSTDPSQNESAMTTLIRKLVGQIPVRGDEPPIVLGPQLITTISKKLMQVINHMAVIQDERGEKRKLVVDGDPYHHSDADTNHASTKRLKAYAQQQSELVHDQKAELASLRHQLSESNAELRKQSSELTVLRNSRQESDDSAIRNLLKQLDTGMQTAARKNKEITALRAVINQDAADMQQKDDMIGVLKSQLERQEEKLRRAESGTTAEATQLQQQVKELHDMLALERRQSATTTRAYMRAAVHALKVQNSRSKKEEEEEKK